jgi:NAD(P) transhydrogenase subunit beta
VAGLLFIMSLAGLSKHETARPGIVYGIAGMVIALAATAGLASGSIDDAGVILLVIALVIGAAIGLWRARVVEMTAMPELIAILHSFVGLGRRPGRLEQLPRRRGERVRLDGTAGALLAIHHAEVFVGVFIGAVTFTGSIVAYLKLSAKISSSPLMLPGRHVPQPRCPGRVRRLTGRLRHAPEHRSAGRDDRDRPGARVNLVASIGGGDMPVVVSMLNSYSGLGGRRLGLPAQQQPADHHRRAGRLVGAYLST